MLRIVAEGFLPLWQSVADVVTNGASNAEAMCLRPVARRAGSIDPIGQESAADPAHHSPNGFRQNILSWLTPGQVGCIRASCSGTCSKMDIPIWHWLDPP